MTPRLSAVLVALLLVLTAAPRASAQTAAPAPVAEPAPPAAAPAAPPHEKKKTGPGPGLSLSPETPQAGGRVSSPAEPPPVVAPEPSAEWKFEVTGYFRAPMRMSWGPAVTQEMNAMGQVIDSGTQLRTPPMVPDANYIDWRYTNTLVAPWTELNFKYGNDRVKAQVQIASYNLTDPGYRRLESNLGINQAFLQLLWPELLGSENWHLSLIVGGFTNRYGAAGRYDAGKYETYLFGRTHVAGLTANVAYDVSDDWTVQVEVGGGGKLEPIPYYGAPGPAGGEPAHATAGVGAVSRPAADGVRVRSAWPPGRGVQEAADPGRPLHRRVLQRQRALHCVHAASVQHRVHDDVDGVRPRQRQSAGQAAHSGLRRRRQAAGRRARRRLPRLRAARRAQRDLPARRDRDHPLVRRLAAARQLLRRAGLDRSVDGKIDTVLFQYVFSFGQLFYHPAPFWGARAPT